MNKQKRRNLPALDTDVTDPHGSTTEVQGSGVIELGDIGDHLGKLGETILTTQKLVHLVTDQLQVLSVTIPVLRALEIMKELRERSKGCHESMEDVLKSLRAYIEREKGLFYTKNAEAIEKIIRKRVEEGVKRKLPVVLKERLKQYEECLKSNGILTDKVKQVTATASARAANSILSVKHSDEEINLIPPHHDWDRLTLETLKNNGGPAVARLARDQGLAPSEDSPDSELARVHNLNMILRHLGIQYVAIPSWNGILLTLISKKMDP